MGSAVWRFRKWRAGDHRSIPGKWRKQVAAHVGPDPAAAARIRRAGARTFVSAHRTLSTALRRTQHVRGQSDDASELFSCVAAPVEAQLSQAFGDLHAKVSAA